MKNLIYYTILLIVLVSISLGEQAEISNISANFEMVKEITFSYINLIYSILDIANIKETKSALLVNTGLLKMETSYTNKTCASCDKMKKSWDKARKAKRYVFYDPDKSKELMISSVDLASDAFREELAQLSIVVYKADKMGLDKKDEPNYAGSESYLAYNQVHKVLESTNEITEHYMKKEYDEKISAAKSILDTDILEKASRILDISDYYNYIASPGGAWERVIEGEDRLNRSINSMLDEWDYLEDKFHSTEVSTPELAIKKEDIEEVLDVDEDPALILNIGKSKLDKAKFTARRAEDMFKEKNEDYVVNAVEEMEIAIRLKQDAQIAFRRVDEIEKGWESDLSNMCNVEYEPKTELAYMYYEEGKKLCTSKSINDKLAGVVKIKKSEKIDSDPLGYKQQLFNKTTAMANKLESMIKLAKEDGISVDTEERILSDFRKSISDMSNLNNIEIWEERLENAIKSIRDKEYEKYKVLENYHKISNISNYDYMFDGDSLNISKGMGNLKSALESYEKIANPNALLKSIKSETTGVCNRYMEYKYKINIYNPLPIDIRDTKVDVEGIPVWIDRVPKFGKNSYEAITREIGVRCKILKEDVIGNSTLYKIKINPNHLMDVLLPITGKVKNVDYEMVQTKDGLVVKDVDKETVVYVVVDGQDQAVEGVRESTNANESVNVTGIHLLESNGVKQETEPNKNSELSSELDEIKNKISSAGKCYIYYGDIDSIQTISEGMVIYNRMLNDAIDKLNLLTANNDPRAKDARKLIDSGKLCDVISMEVEDIETKPRKAKITGLSITDMSIAPIISVVAIVYFMIREGKRPKTKIKRLLKGIE